MNDDYECPYCNAEHEYTGDPLGDDETTEVQCEQCEKFFIVRGCITVSYDAYQADCLNGNPHPMRDCMRYPRVIHGECERRCDTCGKTEDRPATQEEIDKHGDFPTILPKDQWGRKHRLQPVPNMEDLAQCLDCHGAEGSLTATDCPGQRMSSRDDERVFRGGWDFKDGRWVAPAVCGMCAGTKEIPWTYSQSTGKASRPCPCCQ